MKGYLNKYTLILGFIVLLGFIFRTYNFEKAFSFEHDQDLYSWIVKDILINHHQRLIGQVTSVDGVFIGSFYYYLMAIAYFFGRMNPMSAYVPVTLIGLATIVSFYVILKKHFNARVGITAAFIYAVSMGAAWYDRWSVPTQPTVLWSIWFLDVILELYEGNLKYLPLYGFLVGFIWQVHIALLPVTILPIAAYFISGNKLPKIWAKNNRKTVVIAIIIFLITLSPFLLFEVKHDFSQTKAMVAGPGKEMGGPTGKMKFYKVVDASGKEFQERLLYGFDYLSTSAIWIAVLLITIYLLIRKKQDKKIIGLIWGWIFLILAVQFWSKRIVSEYYFTNILPVLITLLALFLDDIDKILVLLSGILYLGINGYWLMTRMDYDQSYFYKKQIVEVIKEDALKNHYPCVALNFIADPGVGVGFRYLLWYNQIDQVKATSSGVPIYNVFIPWQLGYKQNPVHFGRLGVITPTPPVKLITKDECNKSENQLDPLLGYTD